MCYKVKCITPLVIYMTPKSQYNQSMTSYNNQHSNYSMVLFYSLKLAEDCFMRVLSFWFILCNTWGITKHNKHSFIFNRVFILETLIINIFKITLICFLWKMLPSDWSLGDFYFYFTPIKIDFVPPFSYQLAIRSNAWRCERQRALSKSRCMFIEKLSCSK